jgi:hypothetical protein
MVKLSLLSAALFFAASARASERALPQLEILAAGADAGTAFDKKAVRLPSPPKAEPSGRLESRTVKEATDRLMPAPGESAFERVVKGVGAPLAGPFSVAIAGAYEGSAEGRRAAGVPGAVVGGFWGIVIGAVVGVGAGLFALPLNILSIFSRPGW